MIDKCFRVDQAARRCLCARIETTGKPKQIPNTCDSILSQARWICGDLLSRGNYDRDAEGKIEVFKDMAFGGEDLAEHAIET